MTLLEASVWAAARRDEEALKGKVSLEFLERRFPNGLPRYSIIGHVFSLHGKSCEFPGWPITHFEAATHRGFIKTTYAVRIWHDEKSCLVEYEPTTVPS